MPARAEGRRQHLADLHDDRRVWTVLRLANDEEAVQQLETLTGEHAQLHEALVFDPTPTPGFHVRIGRCRHANYGSELRPERQCL